MTIVIDASVAIAASLHDEKPRDRDYAARAMRRIPSEGAVVPALWHLEVANTLLMAERRKRLSPGDASDILQDLMNLGIVTADGADLNRILTLARRHGLTVYDASYVDLAQEFSATLASLDAAMLRAAAAEGVAVFA